MSVLFTNLNLTVGTRSVGPISVPVGLTAASISLSRDNFLNPACTISVAIELSLDGGANWVPLASCFDRGSSAQLWNRTHTALLPISLTIGLDDKTNAARQIRGTITVTGVAFVSTGTLDLTNQILSAVVSKPPASVSIPTQTARAANANATSVTISTYTTPTTTTGCMIVFFSVNVSTASSVVYNSTETLTFVVSSGTTFKGYLYRRLAPTSGAHNIVATAASSDTLHAHVLTFDGVDQTTPVRNTAVAEDESGSTSMTVTMSAGKSSVNDVVYFGGSSGSSLSAQTQTNLLYLNVDASSGANNSDSAWAAGSASAITFTATISFSDVWRCIAASMNAEAGGAAPFLMKRQSRPFPFAPGSPRAGKF